MPVGTDRDEVRRLLEEERAQLVDVRAREEYDELHIAGAVSIPLRELAERAPQELDGERPIVVYCSDYQ